MRLGDIAGTVVTLVVVGIVLGVGLQVLDDVGNSVGAGIGGGAINNTSRGIAEIASWMPTVGLALAAAAVIGVVVYSFYNFA